MAHIHLLLVLDDTPGPKLGAIVDFLKQLVVLLGSNTFLRLLEEVVSLFLDNDFNELPDILPILQTVLDASTATEGGKFRDNIVVYSFIILSVSGKLCKDK
jgi:hypothetical protein